MKCDCVIFIFFLRSDRREVIGNNSDEVIGTEKTKSLDSVTVRYYMKYDSVSVIV